MRQRNGAVRRRRFSWRLLVLAFLVTPLVEIYVIIQVGHVIGALWTILLLVADSLFGAWLIRHEGSRAWRGLQTALREQRMPGKELADGILILVGGTLMLAPGFVTDVIGMLMIAPFSRPVGRRLLSGAITRRLVTAYAPGGQGPRSGPDTVVEGQVIRE